MGKAAGAKWQLMDKEQRAKYIALATEDLARYKAEKEAYDASLAAEA